MTILVSKFPTGRLAACIGLACASAWSSHAVAHGTAQDTAQPGTQPTTSATPAKPTELGKITVTAQNRTQEMQQVPIALNILTAQNIDTVAATDLSRLNLFVPGLVVDATDPTQPTYRLRGIETNDFGIGTDSAVGIYVNGVYQTRAGGALMALNDVARVEVLKGPQGTLFGRNTASGAISIITNEPTDKLEGKARIRFGEYGRRYADALLNAPMGKDMAFRLSVLDNQSNGWLRDAATGRHYGKDDEWGARAVWRWNLTPDTRVLLSWDHDRLKQPSRIDMGLIPLSRDTHQRPPFPANPANFLDPLHAPFYNDSGDGREARQLNSGTLSIDHSFGWGSLTSTTNWTGYRMSHIEDGDGTDHIVSHLDTGVLGSGHTWYQEFKLTGNNDLLDWVSGVSYYQEQARQTSLARATTDTVDTLAIHSGLPTGTPDGSVFGYFDSLLRSFGLPYRLLGDPWTESVYNHGNFKSYAAYGDVIWHLSDRLNLTTGLRYTRDQKSFDWYTPSRYAPALDHTLDQLDQAGVLALAAQLAGTTPQRLRAGLSQNLVFTDAIGQQVQRRNRWSDVSPRLVLDYKFTPDVMGYASLAKGYKAGGYNGVQVNSEFSPEKVWNLETGVKSVFPDQHLLLNASIYYYRYNNRQTLQLVPHTGGAGIPQYRVSNTNQEAKGLELEAQWHPLDDLRLGFNGTYIDSKYRHAIAASGIDISGQPVDEPKISYTLSAGFTWHGVIGGNLAFDAQYGYRGRTRCNADSIYQGKCAVPTTAFDLGEASRRTDLRLDWTSNNDRWGVGAYVNNLFNQRYVGTINNVTALLGTPYAENITPPRMWGIELRAKF
ncbi:TonB-dependent receptor [Dyella tabacisoli]|uniref:TonB-dependent receptor n=1 Tax=Dyella tabacisoli TaxID=2282381 RepID=A0A369ULS6_9GAMM|nr:TonB-dependent receptor [Dyella tabacisoli]RDD80668.1 TonB-dependent receptor [Dyella tabacisoli]